MAKNKKSPRSSNRRRSKRLLARRQSNPSPQSPPPPSSPPSFPSRNDADGTARTQSDDASSSHRDGASSGADNSVPSPALQEDGRGDEEVELRREFNEVYRDTIKKLRYGLYVAEYRSEQLESLAGEFIDCKFRQWILERNNHSSDAVDMNPDESEGSPSKPPQDRNDLGEEGTESESEDEDGHHDPDADFVFNEEEEESDAATTRGDERCVYDKEYCCRFNLSSWWDFYWINLCHEHRMNLKVNDTKDNWERLNHIVEEKRGRTGKSYRAKDKIPLRIRFLRFSYHGSRIFSECTPHPPFNPQRHVKRINLYDDVSVDQALPLIQQVAEATFLSTGERKAVFPRLTSRFNSSIVAKFLEEGGDFAKIAIAVDGLKHRVECTNSYPAQLTLKYLKQKAFLCLNNAVERSEYLSGRDHDDGRVNYYLGVLYQVAGIPLLPKMVKYDVMSKAEQIAERILAAPKHRALKPLLRKQQEVISFLAQNIQYIDMYRLHPKRASRCLLYKYMSMLWGGPGSSCRHCIDSGVPSNHYRRSLSMATVQHVGEAGRLAKQQIAGGKQPTKCSLGEILEMDYCQELQCGDHHIGKEDASKLARLASGESDATNERGSYDYRKLFRSRVLYLTMFLVSEGKSQLGPEDREWILSEASEMDKHHLTTNKDFIDELGTEWETKKSPSLMSDKSFLVQICSLPDGEWEEFIFEELCTCAITGRSDHALLHLVYGPAKIAGLAEYLGLELPWNENDTHIIMPQVGRPGHPSRTRRGYVRPGFIEPTDTTQIEVDEESLPPSGIVRDEEQGLADWPREEVDPEYARLSKVLNTLPMERLLARPCLGDDGCLAPELLELWGRNTVRIGNAACTLLPFRMRNNTSIDLKRVLEGAHRFNQEVQLEVEQGDQVKERQQQQEEQQELTFNSEAKQGVHLQAEQPEEELQLGDDEVPTEIIVHGYINLESEEAMEEEQGYDQNHDNDDRVEEEQHSKLQRKMIKCHDALERDAHRAIIGGTRRGSRGRRRKGSNTSKFLLRKKHEAGQ